jgi:hypothetical protein
MRALLRGSLGRSLKTLPTEDKLVAAWTVACGRVLAGRGTVLGFEDGVLCIEVGDAAWMRQLRGMRSQLASDISGIAGVAVREIDFEMPGGRRMSAAGSGASATTWRKRSVKEKAR